MRKTILVLVGGFGGTLARYLLGAPLTLALGSLPGARAGVPYDILAINLLGAGAIGLIYGLSDRGLFVSANARLALGTGFLGAFTTFSTLAYGGVQLLLAGTWTTGLLYLGGSLALGVALARAGYTGAGLLARGWSLWRSAVQARDQAQPGARPQRAAWVAAVWREHVLDASDQDMACWTTGAQQQLDERRTPTYLPDEVH